MKVAIAAFSVASFSSTCYSWFKHPICHSCWSCWTVASAALATADHAAAAHATADHAAAAFSAIAINQYREN